MVLFLFYSIVFVFFLRLILIFFLLILVWNTSAFFPSVPLPTSWHTRPCLQIGVLEIGKNAGDLETRSLCVPRGIVEESGRFSSRHPVVPQLGRNSKPGQKHKDAAKALSCARTRPKQVEKKVDLSMGGCASVTAASVVLFAHVDLLARVTI